MAISSSQVSVGLDFDPPNVYAFTDSELWALADIISDYFSGCNESDCSYCQAAFARLSKKLQTDLKGRL